MPGTGLLAGGMVALAIFGLLTGTFGLLTGKFGLLTGTFGLLAGTFRLDEFGLVCAERTESTAEQVTMALTYLIR